MKASTLVLVGALAALVPLSAAAQSPVIVVSAGDSFASGQGAPDTPWSYGEVSLGDDADGLVWDIDDRTWDFEDIDEMEAYWMSVSVVAPLNRILAAAVERARGAGPMWHFVSGISARFATHGYCTGSGSPESWSSSVPRYVVTPRLTSGSGGSTRCDASQRARPSPDR